MAEKNVMAHENEEIIAKAQDFWTRYQKQITVVLAVVVLAVGGWYAYKNFIVKPKQKKQLMQIKAKNIIAWIVYKKH
jgi:hypothetical protein